jgi:hypothetical protein
MLAGLLFATVTLPVPKYSGQLNSPRGRSWKAYLSKSRPRCGIALVTHRIEEKIKYLILILDGQKIKALE